MKVDICPVVQSLCAQFAALRLGSSAEEYKKRGEFRISKIENDILVGAMAEFAAQIYLQRNGAKISDPDLSIYAAHQKSFDADLQSKDELFHVKSQTKEAADRYGASWLLQKQDKLIKSPADNEYLVFAIVEETEVEIKAVVRVKDIVDANLLSEPKVPRYRETKVALYLEDVISSGIELWRF